jgi:hypothetical protein
MIFGRRAPIFPHRIADRPLPTRRLAGLVQRAVPLLKKIETQSYLERGRRLQGLTDAQLASKWVIDFKAWRASRSDEQDRGDSTEMDDASAEFRLILAAWRPVWSLLELLDRTVSSRLADWASLKLGPEYLSTGT